MTACAGCFCDLCGNRKIERKSLYGKRKRTPTFARNLIRRARILRSHSTKTSEFYHTIPPINLEKRRLPPVSRDYKITLPTPPDGKSIRVQRIRQSSYNQSSAYQSVGNQPSIEPTCEQIPIVDLKSYSSSNLNSRLNVPQRINMTGIDE